MRGMRRFLLSFLLLVCASSLLGLEIIPPAPDSHTFIRVRTSGSPCGSLIRTDVAVEGSTITLNPVYAPFSGGCPAVIVPVWLDAGLIKAGVYTISVSGRDTAPLIVRDADTDVIVSPVGGAFDIKRTVEVFGVLEGATVLFDGVPATDAHDGGRSLVVTPPPHAPGTVDVTVIENDTTRKAIAAFTYFDPAAVPDPAVFEPVLFPVAYGGAGEFGSQWVTDNVVGTGNTLVRFRQSVRTKACEGVCRDFNWTAFLAPESQSGLLLWVVRRRMPVAVADEFRLASRVVELSNPDSPSTALPVARERDFRESFTIPDVPLSRGTTRITLRLYALGDTIAAVGINGAFSRSVPIRPVNGVAFASVDLAAEAALAGAGRMSVSVNGSGKLWGLVTVTNNKTQAVTALWPQ